jgi:hypothetical protein
MNLKNSVSKQRIFHEVGEFLVLFLFVAPFVLAIASYRLYFRPSESALFAYTTALVNAFALAKIIATAELFKLSKGSEDQPLILSTLHKAAVMTVLYLGFRGMENTVHGISQGQSLLAAFNAAFVNEKGEFLILGVATFFVAIPGFALHEVRRVLGADAFRHLFFGKWRPQYSAESAAGGV